MADTTVKKVESRRSPKGKAGQHYLVSGVHVSMRLWDEDATDDFKPDTRRKYETVGYVIEGSAELRLEGQTIHLEEGDSWLVPAGATRSYQILEHFRAVEATSPPAQIHGRDEE